MASLPVALIPAYKPEPSVVEVARALVAMDLFQAVVCVNDGSGPEYQHLFNDLASLGVTVLNHYVNLGKGMALRTGLNHIACAFPHSVGVVTLDADGQHLTRDVEAVGRALHDNPDRLVIGCRGFGKDVPLRSRFGNIFTRHVMRFVGGIKVKDTQSGLRGIPMLFIPTLLRLSTRGYDFELDMLMKARELGVVILEKPISTVYIDNNKSSHFRPLRDSLAIYFVLLRHTANALLTGALDYIVFSTALAFSSNILAAMVSGRLVAGAFNFYVGKTIVFKSTKNIWRELLAYAGLVLTLMLISYCAITILVSHVHISPYVSKILVELTVFFLSFAAQRIFVFSKLGTEKDSGETDWDAYYKERGSNGSLTRKISEKLILQEINKQESKKFQTITELGGGDSCFYPGMRKSYPNAIYLIVDKSCQGVNKFLSRHRSPKAKAILADLLAAPELPKAELVFSVGLIEHFEAESTARLIKVHFDAASPGGIVLITYPTPTPLYKFIRWCAEQIGVWKFPDERPLTQKEVRTEIEKYGRIITSRLNWYIGLTQEILLAQKKTENRYSTSPIKGGA